MVQPVLKWVGGKRQILNEIVPLIPHSYNLFCEPFFGGGGVCLSVSPTRAVINDINSELIDFYRVVKTHPDKLIKELLTYVNKENFYYSLRAIDREDNFSKLSNIKKAARTYYLNRMGFNGLYRVNKKGYFNVPYGRYKKEFSPDIDAIKALSFYLNKNDIVILNQDYDSIYKYLDSDSFVYLDPPYDPISSTSSFTSYSRYGFTKEDQLKLKLFCDKLSENNIRFMLSNSATDFIVDLYRNYEIKIVDAKRSINSKGSKRGPVKEVIVRNYK